MVGPALQTGLFPEALSLSLWLCFGQPTFSAVLDTTNLKTVGPLCKVNKLEEEAVLLRQSIGLTRVRSRL